MPKVTKQGKGYRIRKTINGRTHSITFDHKPTSFEIDNAVHKLRGVGQCDWRATFESAAEEYIMIKEAVLSPSTIKNYRSVLRNISKDFKRLKLNIITSVDVQREISQYSTNHSPKSVRNLSGFITATLKMFRPDLIISTTLPQKVNKKKLVPTETEVKKVLEESKGTDYEIAYRLAVFGLRKSEIIAVTKDSLDKKDKTLLHIQNAKVVNSDGRYVKKTTKTEAGTRSIHIDQKTADMIRKKGCAYDGFPGNILRDLHRIQERLGLEKFNLHSFRAYYASFAHANGVPDVYIMKTGGWKSQQTLDNIYRKALEGKQETIEKKLVLKLTKAMD